MNGVDWTLDKAFIRKEKRKMKSMAQVDAEEIITLLSELIEDGINYNEFITILIDGLKKVVKDSCYKPGMGYVSPDKYPSWLKNLYKALEKAEKK